MAPPLPTLAELAELRLSVLLVIVRVANLRRKWSTIPKAGWSSGCVLAIDSQGRTTWIVDAHRGDGKRFVVRAEEKLTAFLELESAIRAGTAIATRHSAFN
jgi:hypothetical protein